jgi:hypothetical protein
VLRSQNVKQDRNVAFSRMFRNRNVIELSNPKYGARRSGEAIQQMRVADFLLPNTGGGGYFMGCSYAVSVFSTNDLCCSCLKIHS